MLNCALVDEQIKDALLMLLQFSHRHLLKRVGSDLWLLSQLELWLVSHDLSFFRVQIKSTASYILNVGHFEFFGIHYSNQVLMLSEC